MANEFLQAMAAAGVDEADTAALHWPGIIQDDALWSAPISLMSELYEHDTLAEIVIRLIRRKSRREMA